MELLKEILTEIKPSKKEEQEVQKKIREVLKKINSGLKNAKATLGGSGAKGTWLKNAHDADIFVQYDYDQENISEKLEKHLKKKFKITKLHGSRDYYQIKTKEFTYEIVPITKITKARKAKNITDVSPLHANWVKKHRQYADDIRLTKQFCKANKVYGAESYIRGLSGYICEILTIHYKGFLKLLRAASKWEEKTIIDTEKYYKNKNEILFELNNSKLTSPLIVIDPVQSDRNAAAAINKEKYEEFKELSKKFLKKPEKKYFETKKITEKELKGNIKIEITAKQGKKDIIGSKIKKVYEYIKAELERKEFKIKNSGWEWEKKALLWYDTDKKPLSKIVEKQGPLTKLTQNVEAFKKKHKKTYVKGTRIYVKEKRKYQKPEELIKELIKSEYVKEKVKTIKILK